MAKTASTLDHNLNTYMGEVRNMLFKRNS